MKKKKLIMPDYDIRTELSGIRFKDVDGYTKAMLHNDFSEALRKGDKGY